MSEMNIWRGSREAIADCRQRLTTAQVHAHAELDREDGGIEPLNADDFEDVRDYDVASEGDEQ
jgi:hypothetical protein